MGQCSRSALITFIVRVSKQQPVNISTSAGYYRGTVGLGRLRIEIKHRYPCFNVYAPEHVPIFYSAIKHRYRCFIS